MSGLGLALSIAFVPEIREEMSLGIDAYDQTLHEKNGRTALSRIARLRLIMSMFNPLRIFGKLLYPNVLFAVSDLV